MIAFFAVSLVLMASSSPSLFVAAAAASSSYPVARIKYDVFIDSGCTQLIKSVERIANKTNDGGCSPHLTPFHQFKCDAANDRTTLTTYAGADPCSASSSSTIIIT